MTTADAAAKPIRLTPVDKEIKAQSPTQRVIKRFTRHRAAMFGLVLLAGVILYIIIGSLLFSEAQSNFNDTAIRLQPPSSAHPFGTDRIGRDILARTIYGGQISLLIGFFAVVVEVGFGTAVGAVAGYYGGWVDRFFSGFLFNVFMSFPSLLLAIAMVAFLGPSLRNLILALSIIGWVGYARLIRGQVLKVREYDFVTAARAIGTSDFRIVWQHILPNAIQPLMCKPAWEWRARCCRKRA